MPEVKKVKGREVRIWDKSFSVLNRKSQKYHFTGVLFIGVKPKIEMIEKFCEALDSAYEAGKISAKKELRVWLGLEK